MNLEDFHKICRICTSSGTLLSLHEHKLKELLQKITDLQFTPEDMLPENICILCSEKLESIDIFINKCKKNSIIFENVLQQLKEDVKKEDENEYSEQEDDVGDNLSLSESDDPYPDPTADDVIDSARISEALRDIEEIEQNDKQVTDKGKCRTCRVRLPLGGLKIHYQNSPECTPKCPICSKSFYPTCRLKSHILSHGKKPSYKCPACKTIFPSAKNLRKHVLQIHPDVKPFVCKVCQKGFLKKLSLDEHMNFHTGATPYICAYCGMGFQRACLHAKHIYHSHNNDTRKIPKLKRKYTEKRVNLHLECKECGKVFASRSGFATHQLNHKGVLSFLCSLCGKKFVTNASLQVHILKHTGETPFKCKRCGKGFKKKFVLAKHEMLHNLKSFHCPECNEQFQMETDFNNHMLKHGKHDSPLTCPECPQKFYHELILQNHLVSHRDKKRKKCTVCSKSFALSYFSSHMRTHSGEKAYRCETCGKSFTVSKSLKIHMRLHTGELPYSCSVCYKRFSDPSNKNSHFKKCHGKVARPESSSEKAPLEEDNV